MPLGDAISVGSRVSVGKGIVGDATIGSVGSGVRLADGVESPNTCVPLLNTMKEYIKELNFLPVLLTSCEKEIITNSVNHLKRY